MPQNATNAIVMIDYSINLLIIIYYSHGCCIWQKDQRRFYFPHPYFIYPHFRHHSKPEKKIPLLRYPGCISLFTVGDDHQEDRELFTRVMGSLDCEEHIRINGNKLNAKIYLKGKFVVDINSIFDVEETKTDLFGALKVNMVLI